MRCGILPQFESLVQGPCCRQARRPVPDEKAGVRQRNAHHDLCLYARVAVIGVGAWRALWPRARSLAARALACLRARPAAWARDAPNASFAVSGHLMRPTGGGPLEAGRSARDPGARLAQSLERRHSRLQSHERRDPGCVHHARHSLANLCVANRRVPHLRRGHVSTLRPRQKICC